MKYPTYFIRHKLGLDEKTYRDLWTEHKIAIHFPWTKSGNKSKDTTSLDPDDYEDGAKKAMRAIVNLGESGGYVYAKHESHPECMLGFVKPHTNIELIRGKWADNPGRTAVIKTLQLTKVRLVNPVDYAVLHVGQPQGTITRWPRAGEVVENIIEGRRKKLKWSDLHYRQQEILCSEFLRSEDAASLGLPRLAYLLLPVGGTMPDIDVKGIADDGKMLLAQVTFDSLSHPKTNRKIQRLRDYRDPKRHLLFFCQCDALKNQDGVTIFPIERAFTSFTSTKLGKLWLEHSGLKMATPGV